MNWNDCDNPKEEEQNDENVCVHQIDPGFYGVTGLDQKPPESESSIILITPLSCQKITCNPKLSICDTCNSWKSYALLDFA